MVNFGFRVGLGVGVIVGVFVGESGVVVAGDVAVPQLLIRKGKINNKMKN